MHISRFVFRSTAVYIYGFSKIEGGRCHGAFYHEDFLRGKKERCLTIGRNKSGDRRLKSTVSKKALDIMVDQTGGSDDDNEQQMQHPLCLPSLVAFSMPAVGFLLPSVSPGPTGALPMEPLQLLSRQPSDPTSSGVPASKSAAVARQGHLEDEWLQNTFDLDPVEEMPSAVAAARPCTSPPYEWDMSVLEPRSIEQMQSTPLVPSYFPFTEAESAAMASLNRTQQLQHKRRHKQTQPPPSRKQPPFPRQPEQSPF